MTNSIELKVQLGNDGSRLDIFIASSIPELSRSQTQALIHDGLILVDGSPAKRPSFRIETGQQISVPTRTSNRTTLTPYRTCLEVVYEDEAFLIIDKPAGMPVHPGPGHTRDTLSNAIVTRWPDTAGVGDIKRPGIVHRLDADTSGLIVIAKLSVVHAALATQFANRTVEKGYLALVEGTPPNEQAIIEAPIGRSPHDRKKMAVVTNGRSATTQFKVIKSFSDRSLVEAMPKTGRTHQIRVHFASIGHPIVGDETYGHRDPLLMRQFLHASRLGFDHPLEHHRLVINSPLPDELRRYLSEVLNFSLDMKGSSS